MKKRLFLFPSKTLQISCDAYVQLSIIEAKMYACTHIFAPYSNIAYKVIISYFFSLSIHFVKYVLTGVLILGKLEK